MGLEAPKIEDISPGQSAQREFTFSPEIVARFGDLVDDHAPVHFDAPFAQGQGFDGTIVHGYLLAGIFSGILGQRLPGPYTVINALSLKYHHAVAVGETVAFEAAVEQVSPAVGAVVLRLTATKGNGDVAVSGRTTCSFRTT
ncbi:MAG TPA: enoyl-CoA hydratase [Rhodospirillaceae bacterium]|nr:enoyl-CoA hydratase [Rhodospirillaceae bacterium]|tara:strand:+ start:3231 stop:3656 length:426 start_codon:yes stop_codon:yes gene_type:complete